VRRLLAVLLPALAAGAIALIVIPSARTADLTLDMGGWEGAFATCRAAGTQDQAGKCVQDLVRDAARRGEIGAGLVMLRRGVAENPTLVGRCHNETHALGQATIEQGHTLADAYAVDFPDCRFGYYHGALEAHTRDLGLDALSAEMPHLCSPFGGEESEATGECVHVLGHFVFDRVAPDVGRGLATCGVLPEVRLQGRCVDGLLMQGIDLVRGAVGDPTHERHGLLVEVWGGDAATQERRVLSICDSVDEGTIVYTCYTNASQALAVLWRKDYPAIHRFCETVDRSWQQPCYEGIAASGFQGLEWDIEAIADACHAGVGENTKYCMQTLAFTFALQGTRAQWESVCGRARPYELAACREGIDRGLEVRSSIAGEVVAVGGVRTDPGNDYGIYSK